MTDIHTSSPEENMPPPEGESETIRMLKETNQALSEFGHAVSHDLKAPLRHIVTYSDMLREMYGPQLGENGVKFTNRLAVNARRATALVEDLLAYAEAAEPRDEKILVDLNAIYDDTVNDLQDTIEESRAYVLANDLPQVMGHASRLRQLFRNLIENALRYKSAAPPVIGISVATLENEYLLSVQDNGIGIAPEFHAQVFEPLKRLHSRDEIEGSGLGLAASRRIVELHGGKMWLESREGEGATFFFTLPKPNAGQT